MHRQKMNYSMEKNPKECLEFQWMKSLTLSLTQIKWIEFQNFNSSLKWPNFSFKASFSYLIKMIQQKDPFNKFGNFILWMQPQILIGKELNFQFLILGVVWVLLTILVLIGVICIIVSIYAACLVGQFFFCSPASFWRAYYHLGVWVGQDLDWTLRVLRTYKCLNLPRQTSAQMKLFVCWLLARQ